MTEPREITVDLSHLTFGDLLMLEEWQDGKARARDVIALLDRAVVGGVQDLPLSEMGAIADAIKVAMGQASNPKN